MTDHLHQIETRYLNQDITDFILEGGDIHEYAALVFAGRIFGTDDPTAPDLGIHTEADLIAALEALVDNVGVTIRTQDPYTTGEVYGDGPAPIDAVSLPVSTDEDEWNEQAAASLEEQGYNLAGPWTRTASGIEARAVLNNRTCDGYYPVLPDTGFYRYRAAKRRRGAA